MSGLTWRTQAAVHHAQAPALFQRSGAVGVPHTCCQLTVCFKSRISDCDLAKSKSCERVLTAHRSHEDQRNGFLDAFCFSLNIGFWKAETLIFYVLSKV